MMHGGGKSDLVIVAVKPANKEAPRCGAVRGGISRCGVGGAKDGDQGECGSAKHAPDSVPGARVTDAGPHAASLLSFGPEVGEAMGRAAEVVAPSSSNESMEVAPWPKSMISAEA